jgi:hypothetical protein
LLHPGKGEGPSVNSAAVGADAKLRLPAIFALSLVSSTPRFDLTNPGSPDAPTVVLRWREASVAKQIYFLTFVLAGKIAPAIDSSESSSKSSSHSQQQKQQQRQQ